MSRDGYLPDDVRESDLPGADDEHAAGCPCHEDEPEIYSECGGEAACICVGRDTGCKPLEPECICADIAEIDKLARADAAYDRMREASDEAL